ncbi:MAG: Gfo/Idh/MocA family oxidoreductase [Candidatus Eremiobacterota bacterium]
MTKRFRPLRLGMIGCGRIASVHASALGKIHHAGLVPVELVHACDVAPERAERFQAEHGFQQVAADYRTVLEDSSLDAVFVCTPTAQHLPAVLLAAEVGRPIFCEKPLGPNLREVEEMCQAVERAGLHAQLGLFLRFSSVCNVMRAHLEEGGHPMAAVFRDDQYFPAAGRYGGDWRSKRELIHSGPLLEHSIHAIDLLRWFFGEITRVHARMEFSSQQSGIENRAVLLLEFECGLAATLVSLWHQVEGRSSSRHLEIFLEKRYLASACNSGTVQVQEQSQRARTLSSREVGRQFRRIMGKTAAPAEFCHDPYLLEDLAFLRSLAQRTPPFPDFATGLVAHRVVEAAYQSAWEFQPVEPARVLAR